MKSFMFLGQIFHWQVIQVKFQKTVTVATFDGCNSKNWC